MFIIGHILSSLAALFNIVFTILYFLLIVRIALSWFPVSPYNELVITIYRITDPIMRPFQRLPLRVGMIDFSPILAFIILYVLRDFVVETLRGAASRFF